MAIAHNHDVHCPQVTGLGLCIICACSPQFSASPLSELTRMDRLHLGQSAPTNWHFPSASLDLLFVKSFHNMKILRVPFNGFILYKIIVSHMLRLLCLSGPKLRHLPYQAVGSDLLRLGHPYHTGCAGYM